MLLISASDKSLKASCASIEPLSARRRRRGSDLEANEGRGRDSVDMVADEKIVDDSGVDIVHENVTDDVESKFR